jgi:hypothetical protein
VKKDLADHVYNALDEVLLRVLARGRARSKRGGDVDGVFWYTKHVSHLVLEKKTKCIHICMPGSSFIHIVDLSE